MVARHFPYSQVFRPLRRIATFGICEQRAKVLLRSVPHSGDGSRFLLAVNYIRSELLHEARYADLLALPHNVANPFNSARSCVRTALTADNHPVDVNTLRMVKHPTLVDPVMQHHRTNQRLDRQEQHRGEIAALKQQRDIAVGVLLFRNACSQPQIWSVESTYGM